MYTKNLDLVFFHCQKAITITLNLLTNWKRQSQLSQLNSKDYIIVYKNYMYKFDYRKKMELNEHENIFIETIRIQLLYIIKFFIQFRKL